MRENRTHGSEGGDGESRLRPLSKPSCQIIAWILPADVFSKEDTKRTKFGDCFIRTPFVSFVIFVVKEIRWLEGVD